MPGAPRGSGEAQAAFWGRGGGCEGTLCPSQSQKALESGRGVRVQPGAGWGRPLSAWVESWSLLLLLPMESIRAPGPLGMGGTFSSPLPVSRGWHLVRGVLSEEVKM